MTLLPGYGVCLVQGRAQNREHGMDDLPREVVESRIRRAVRRRRDRNQDRDRKIDLVVG